MRKYQQICCAKSAQLAIESAIEQDASMHSGPTHFSAIFAEYISKRQMGEHKF